MSTEVIPYLIYRDVPAALDWLEAAFGLVRNLALGTPSGGMHAEMTLDGRMIMLGGGGQDPKALASPRDLGGNSQGVFVYMAGGVDAHRDRAAAHGAEIVQEPADHGYGRTYWVRDLEGHDWFFTERPPP